VTAKKKPLPWWFFPCGQKLHTQRRLLIFQRPPFSLQRGRRQQEVAVMMCLIVLPYRKYEGLLSKKALFCYGIFAAYSMAYLM